MTKMTKILLAVSLISFAASVTGTLWGLVLPVGAIAFGAFLISIATEKEMELYDAEQCLRASTIEKNHPVLITLN
jgi:hypothetical protein